MTIDFTNNKPTEEGKYLYRKPGGSAELIYIYFPASSSTTWDRDNKWGVKTELVTKIGDEYIPIAWLSGDLSDKFEF